MNSGRNQKPKMLGAMLILLVAATPATADVTFFVERYGSPEDSGQSDFLQGLTQYHEEDFESSDLGPVWGLVPQLSYGDIELQLTGNWGEGNVPCILYSTEFNMPGKMYGRALLPGSALTVTPDSNQPLGAFGLWLFDDGRAYDAAYRLTVTEVDGTFSEVVLENAIGHNAKGHELEGFIGVVSDVGIAELTVIAIDPETGDAIPDVFETDHWIMAPFIPTSPPPPVDPCLLCGDLDGDQDVDLDDYLIFLRAFGHNSNSAQYVVCADLDQDGIISLVDFQAWLQCYRNWTGAPIPEVSGERAFKRLFPRHAGLWPKHRRLGDYMKGTAAPPRRLQVPVVETKNDKSKCSNNAKSPVKAAQR